MSEKINDLARLRIIAEAEFAHALTAETQLYPAEKLLYELEVHRIELQMQNESLRETLILIEESRDRYVDFYDFAPAGYLTLNRDGLIAEINLTGASMLGEERGKLSSRRFSAFVSPEDQDRWYQYFLLVIQHDNKQTCELELLRNDGSRAYVQLDSRRLAKEGKPTVVRITLTDITDRKMAEMAIIESEMKFRTLFDSIADAVFIDAPNGKFLHVNRTACDRLGYSQQELLRLSPAEINAPEYAAKIAQRRDEIIRGGQYILETVLVCKDGRQLPVELNCKVIEINKTPAFLVVARDILARKQTEDAMAKSFRQMEVNERSKTRFLAAASHDLRQPVTAASLFLYALKMTSPSERQSELIQKLDESMKTFADLLEQLLDISKFDAGLVKPELTSFNLAELFSWLEQNFMPGTPDKYLRFRFYFPKHKSLIVRTDIGLLKSVLMNLVSNALKFTSHGGILVSARIHGGKVKFQVWDSGIGIDAASRAHIFDEFYQVANPQRNRSAGLGLGLSICRRTLSVLGSEITCSSIIGRGSVFTFSLPLDGKYPVVREAPVKNTFAEVDLLFVRDKRIVVVEDDDLVASGLVSLLQELGAVVRRFNNAEEALRQDDIAGADYFIVDYALGGEFTGLNFLVALQQRQRKPIRAVVITGETSSQFMRNVVDSPWPVLHKPINFARLAGCLRSFDAFGAEVSLPGAYRGII